MRNFQTHFSHLFNTSSNILGYIDQSCISDDDSDFIVVRAGCIGNEQKYSVKGCPTIIFVKHHYSDRLGIEIKEMNKGFIHRCILHSYINI